MKNMEKQRNLRVIAGRKYACPVCGKVFSTRHLYGDVDFVGGCECMVQFADGFIRVDEENLKFMELIDPQERIMWVLNSINHLPPDHFYNGRYYPMRFKNDEPRFKRYQKENKARLMSST
jgi:hypothetical protein